VPPPVAVSVVLCPEQMVVTPPIVGTGNGVTVTATDCDPVQPPVVTVTLYVVLLLGVTVIAAVLAPVSQE
jgi:hypothetical protein